MDDKDAIEETLHGATEAFGSLVTRYQSMVYAIALARVYDHQDALDLSQEVFLRAYTRLPMLKNRDAFAPWLFMILRRLCVDFLRGKWRNERLQQTVRDTERSTPTSTDAEKEIGTADTFQTLWSRVAQLDDKSREVLSLHYGQEMKLGEIAALTGMKESAVKMRLHRARAVLGERIGDLKGVWGIAPLPTFSAGVMKAVTAVGPVKGGIAANPFLGGVLALVASFWWSAGRDLNRWQDDAPAGMLSQGRRTIARSALVLAAAMILPTIVATAIALALVLVRPLNFLIPFAIVCWAVFMVVMVTLLGAILKREIDLLSPEDKAKQLINAGAVIVFFAIMCIFPAYALGAMGVFLALQYFFVNSSNIALGTVPPGFWVAPVLKHTVAGKGQTIPVAKDRIKPWLTMLHEYGLVAPPLKNDDESFTVRLRLRGSLFEKMAWRSYSTLLVDTRGVVSCTVVPRDYVALAQLLELEELPSRQELAKILGDSFTAALGTYADGGDKVAVANSLGLDLCPIDSSKTNIFLLNKYGLPIAGLVLIALFVFRRFF